MTNHFLEIPDSFWSLFRSKNRQIYIDALLQVNEEYQYSNYYLSREICIQTLSDYFAKQKVTLEQEEAEDDFDLLEPLSTRIVNWLLRTGWLRKVEDYHSMTVNIVIPDYAAMFVDTFVHLSGEDEDETQVYIQNVYAILFAFKNDPRSNISLLKTALVNTRKLNKTLQDILHNMDKFFSSLLEQKFYGDLLKEHLDGYVEEIVRKKYHILKTSDNFYLYKADIKKWLGEMRQNLPWLEQVCVRNKQLRGKEIQVNELIKQIDMIERGFDDIEHRIINMDKEHTRYIRATVTRLQYLLNKEDNMKGRRTKQDFVEGLLPEEETEELTGEEILKLNKIKNRYSRREVEEFILRKMKDGRLEVTKDTISSTEDFEKLVLAYDSSTRKDSPYRVKEQGIIDNGKYRYPNLVFERKGKE